MSARTRVKICGITRLGDALCAIHFGADALGFNLFPGSKRFISLDENAAWIRDLPPFVSKIAVLVNLPIAEARRIAAHSAIDMVQFHGDEDPEYCAEFAREGRPFIKALRLANAAAIDTAADFSTQHVLIDAHVPDAFGGTGASLDLALATALARRHPRLHLILAGGLTPSNVGDAIRAVCPYAVDVASGVEDAPGVKSADLLQSFISAARG